MNNNSICEKCGIGYVMGWTGKYWPLLCDKCAGITRDKDGWAYYNDTPFMIKRRLRSAYFNAKGPRPGDTVQLHPNRKMKHE